MKSAAFLDRDGVINERIKGGYVTNWEEFQFLAGVKEAVASLKKQGFLVIIVTNQKGVARGLMSEEDLGEIHRRMQEELGGENIDAVYFCPHSEEEKCQCRKPRPAMFLSAQKKFNIDFNSSYIIGDSPCDMGAGETLGLKKIFIGRDVDYHGPGKETIFFVPDLLRAAKIIKEKIA